MGMTVSASGRRLLYVAMGAAIAVVPAVALSGSHESVLAACNDVVDTTDNFSMNCVPTVIPDTSDQLTEAEVASPGWNATPGGSGSTGHGGHG
ncbi:MAG: hypothetical protein WCP30_04975 [Mycobacteriaceae bacterium]